jgi:epoxyqueuosine reductase QueG
MTDPTDEMRALRDIWVTVCDKCSRASCWKGEFMCDEARSAGTVKKHISELGAMGLEHPDYWKEG